MASSVVCETAVVVGPGMSREQAEAIVARGEEAVVFAILELSQRLGRALGQCASVSSPATPSGMIPVHQKPSSRKRGNKPGRKPGHRGSRRPRPERIDEHQDHRTIAQLTWNTFRNHVIAEYEIPKFEGDLGHPNVFVPLDGETAERKVELLMQHFGSQRSKGWFRPETFRGLMALRSVECASASGWAEAFHVRKLVL